MNKIVNIKSGEPYDIYCGRANATYGLSQSKWANPFPITASTPREEVILKYRLWINSQPSLLAALPELQNKTLACWCNFPTENCHCAVLIELAHSKNIKNWFSNMLPFDEPLVYQRITYATPENFYQAMKVSKEVASCRAEIAAMTPFQAKRVVRDAKRFPPNPLWNTEVKHKAMRYALDYKFAPGTSWAKKLEMTDDWEIVEWNNWNDTYWGKDIMTHKGENMLGKMLMEIRSNNRMKQPV